MAGPMGVFPLLLPLEAVSLKLKMLNLRLLALSMLLLLLELLLLVLLLWLLMLVWSLPSLMLLLLMLLLMLAWLLLLLFMFLLPWLLLLLLMLLTWLSLLLFMLLLPWVLLLLLMLPISWLLLLLFMLPFMCLLLLLSTLLLLLLVTTESGALTPSAWPPRPPHPPPPSPSPCSEATTAVVLIALGESPLPLLQLAALLLLRPVTPATRRPNADRGSGEIAAPFSSSSPFLTEIFGLENDPALAEDAGDRISPVVLWVPEAVLGRESHSHDGPGTAMRLWSELQGPALGPADCWARVPAASVATLRLSIAWKAVNRTNVSAMTWMYLEHHPIMTISFSVSYTHLTLPTNREV